MTIVNYFCTGEHNRADLPSSTKNAPHEDWMLLGPKDVNFRSYIFVGNDLQTCGFSSTDKLCDDQEVGQRCGEDENGNEDDLE
jgi:hypothetical protein